MYKSNFTGNDFSITDHQNQGLDRPFDPQTFNPAMYAKNLLLRHRIILYAGVLYQYLGATSVDDNGVFYGGRYMYVSSLDVQRLIATEYPVLIASANDVKFARKIFDYIMLYAPKIVEDLSNRRELLIFSDGGFINTKSMCGEVKFIGSDKFFSQTLKISSADYRNAPNHSQALDKLAWLQAGENAGAWLKVLLEIGGYMIAGVPEKHFLCLQGASNSFKSAFINAIASCWHIQNICTQTMDRFSGNFAMAGVPNAAFILFNDAKDGTVKDSVISMLKSVTGGDYVPVEKKHQDPFSMQVNAPVVIVTNNPVPLDDAGAYNRAVCLPFFCTVPPEFGGSLLLEMQRETIEIFKECLDAHFNRRREGKHLVGYASLNSYVQPPVDVSSWQQLVPNFIIGCLRHNENSKIFKNEIFADFVQWIKNFGFFVEVDYQEFCRTFNKIFCLIYPNRASCLCQVRIGEESSKGLSNFCIAMPQYRQLGS